MAKTRSNGYIIATVLIILAGTTIFFLSFFADRIEWIRALPLSPGLIFWIGVTLIAVGLCMIPKFRREYVSGIFQDKEIA